MTKRILIFTGVALLWCNTGFSQTDTLSAKVDFAAKSALKYLHSMSPLKSQNFLMLVEYMERAYGLRDNLNTKKYLQAAPVYDDEKEQMKFFSRLYGLKSNFTKADLEKLKGLAWLMAYSVNADRFSPDKRYNETMWAYSNNQDRDVAHAALSFAWLKELGLEKFVQHPDSLLKLQVKNLLLLAEYEKYSDDSGMEGLVGLMRLGRSSMIKPEWISKILAAQNKDGGWPLINDENVNESNLHTTLLGLWILLDYKNKGKVLSKWIPDKQP